MNNKTLRLVTAAVCGAIYAAMTVLLAPISYGPVQLRLSELLCILPYYMPCTAWGLFAGCLIANLLTGNVMDIVFGSLATLIAALLTALIGRRRRGMRSLIMSGIPPVLCNALIIGWVLIKAYGGMDISREPKAYALYACQIALSEAAVIFAAAVPLMKELENKAFFREFTTKLNGGQP